MTFIVPCCIWIDIFYRLISIYIEVFIISSSNYSLDFFIFFKTIFLFVSYAMVEFTVIKF